MSGKTIPWDALLTSPAVKTKILTRYCHGYRYDPAGNLLNDTTTTVPTQGGWVKGNRLRVFQDYRFDYDDVGNLIEEKKGKP